MIKLATVFLSALLVGGMALPAAALSASEIRQCKALSASMKVRHGELTQKGESRTELAADVEAAGDVWEDAEVIRNFSSSHAADADAKKAIYETKKAEFRRIEMSFQADANQLNRDAADYNAACAPN